MGQTINPNDPKAADVHSALQRLLLKISEHPEQAPRSYAAVARKIGVNTATLWRHRKAETRVSDLLEQIVRTGKAGRLWSGPPEEADRSTRAAPALALTKPEEGDLNALTAEELERRASQSLQKARWALQRFVGRGKYHRHPSDLPRAIFELEKALMQARSQLQTLRPLTEEWLRRSEKPPTSAVDSEHHLEMPFGLSSAVGEHDAGGSGSR